MGGFRVQGRVLSEIDTLQEDAARLAEDQVDTYETIVPPRDPSAEVDPAIEAEALERLKALGYIE